MCFGTRLPVVCFRVSENEQGFLVPRKHGKRSQRPFPEDTILSMLWHAHGAATSTAANVYRLSRETVSPFATLLHELRMRHDVRQNELAELIGYDQTYISALEIGSKGPPTAEFVDRLVAGLQLSSSDEMALRNAVADSERKLTLDSDAPEELYRMVAALRRRLPELHPAQARLIREIINLPDVVSRDAPEPVRRLRRRRKMEAPM